MECIPNEYMTCMHHSSVNAFYKVWHPYLVHFGPTRLSSILQGYLNLDSLSLHLYCFKNIPPITLPFVYMLGGQGGWGRTIFILPSFFTFNLAMSCLNCSVLCLVFTWKKQYIYKKGLAALTLRSGPLR